MLYPATPVHHQQRTIAGLALALVALALVMAVHMYQEISYWEVLEAKVKEERRLQEQWAEYARQARSNAAKFVSDSQNWEGGEGGGGAAAGAPCQPTKCPACKPEKCPEKVVCKDKKCPVCATCNECPELSCPKGGSEKLYKPLMDAGSTAAPYFDPKANGGMDFKVFVYDLPEKFHVGLKKEQKRCINDQYGTEIRIHEDLKHSKFRTKDPNEAEFFFVPIYGECHLYRESHRLGKEGLASTNRFYREALSIVKNEYPYWNQTQGRDHVFVFAGARGPHIFRDWKRNIKKSIFMTPEGDRSLSEQFNTWKDIVIPGLENDKPYWTGSLHNIHTKKSIFAFFKGTIHNKEGKSYSKGIRIHMEHHFKNETDVVFSEATRDCNRDCYRDKMSRSTFCLCPRGWSPWTLRAYQAMMAGCIPVIIADEIEFPYESRLDWSQMTVKIAEKDANNTIKILRTLTDEQIDAKRRMIDKHWRKVAWQQPSKPGDAFHTVMEELGTKRRFMKASSYTFWN